MLWDGSDLFHKIRNILFHSWYSKRYFNSWTISSLAVSLLIAAPIFFIISHVFLEPSDAWLHIKKTWLNEYIRNTLLLVVGTAFFTFVLGVVPAWLVSVYRFPGHKFFEWAFVLPLAVPVYIMSYTYADMFSSTGLMRKIFGRESFLLFEFKSLSGAIICFSFSLYPYVYLMAKNAFKQQSALVLSACRLFCHSHFSIFIKTAIPLAFPAISAGLLLVVMEVMSDYGTVSYCTCPTFTVGIFKAWYSLEDSQAAMRLSAILLCPAFSLWILRWFVVRNRLHDHDVNVGENRRFGRPSFLANTIIVSLCSLMLFFTFVLPVSQLIYWAYQTAGEVVNSAFLSLVKTSVCLALGTAFITLTIAVLITYTVKIRHTYLAQGVAFVSKSGYTLPAAVVAISAMTMCKWFDDSIGEWSGWFLSNSTAALVFAYAVRFLAVAFEPVNSGFVNVGHSVTQTCFSLGSKPLRTLVVHLQMMKAYLFSALVLIFVDILKEFNLTFLVGPTYETLATDAYSRAISEEAIPHSSCSALTIIFISSVFLLCGKMGLNRLNNKQS
ncbi:ABC transporter permease [Candidatus Uabimicrobium amorphum]|uniref:ABC transporter permease n=1 Tax=Uabimicrobium amorphum TaxID=2596890 RepID=A0A5S9IL34_UABAM|nr:iron ABC transporter permease [Candidatus Uabimicrobium amorphum]BBM83868.1 ABC transporter permease [Candidatus Uabimicrobium amorphum]